MLQGIGFTETEARVYLALLAAPPTSGYQVSIRAGVPRSMVYEALGRLEARGAVLRTAGRRGSLYSPVLPGTVLDNLEQGFHARVASVREDLARRVNAGRDDRFWTGRGPEIIHGLATQLLDSSSGELLIIMADPEIERHRASLEAACSRGVRLGVVLTGQLDAPCGLWARHPPRESQIQQLDRLLLIVADTEQALIADLRGEGSATITTNSHMVHIARQFVWMELLTQLLNASGAPDSLAALPQQEREFLEALGSLRPRPAAPSGTARRRSGRKVTHEPIKHR